MADFAAFRSMGDGSACDCGVANREACRKTGVWCRAIPMTKQIRQAQSAAALADQPRRQAEARAEEQKEHNSRYEHVFDRLQELGLDPHELRDALEGLERG